MTRRRRLVAGLVPPARTRAVLGLLGLCGLLGGLLGGCAPAAGDEEPRSAAELVADAQQWVRFWGSGHLAVHQVMRPRDRLVTAVWASDYDLNQQRWDATVGDASGRVRYRWIGTADRIYLTSPDRRGAELGMWTAIEAGSSAGTQPHLDAVLSFRPGRVLRREAGGWSVAGTVPMPVALVATGTYRGQPDEAGEILAAEGTAPAVLLIGHDRQVRELRIRGADVEVTSGLSGDLRSRLKDATTSIVLSELGARVRVDQPPETARILAPVPTPTVTPTASLPES